jgi:hypothetical protein
LIGAASAGFSKYAGVNLYGQNPVVQGAGYMLSGAVMGGGVAQLTGGDFGEGFVRGLKTAAFGYAFNQMRMGQRIGKFVGDVWTGTKHAFASAGKGLYSNKENIEQAIKMTGKVVAVSKAFVFVKAGTLYGSLHAPAIVNCLNVNIGSMYATKVGRFAGNWVMDSLRTQNQPSFDAVYKGLKSLKDNK